MSLFPPTLRNAPLRDSLAGLARRVPGRWPFNAAFAAIVALAAALRFVKIGAIGYANHYYTAAVAAMLQSPHNFFFVAAEPGGSVSIDKPPVGLWVETLSALLFGVNGVAVVLPEILAGIAAVALLYYLVRRSFGEVAGLLAALALAITPVFVATNRNNTMDSVLVLTLLVAAWAFIRATENGRLRYLLGGALLVGIGFNIKMLEAFLPLPAFFALYFFGSTLRLGRKIANLALAGVVIAVVSLSWAVAVDLTPADERPYVGSSGDNSVLNLAIGYNGTQRLLGMGGGRGRPGVGPGGAPRDGQLAGQNDGQNARLAGQLTDGAAQSGTTRIDGQRSAAPGATQTAPNGVAPAGDGVTTFAGAPDGNGPFPLQPFGAAGGPPMGIRGGFGGGPGGMGTGQPGPLRLFTAPLSKELSWLLPFGLFGALLLGLRARPRWPLAREHQALVLWGGWLLTGAAFFSVAGFFHEYYLSTIAPPLAILFGIGAALVWDLRSRHRWLASIMLVVAAGATLALQRATAVAFVGSAWWLLPVIGVAGLGAALALAAAIRDRRRVALAGFGLVVGALLLVPGVWSGLTTLNATANQSLPSAYGGREGGFGPAGPAGPVAGLSVDQKLVDYLTPRTQGMTWLMAVPSSMQGADYVLATGRGVLYLGGFMGQDEVVTAESLAQLVAEGKLRYIYEGGAGGRGGPGGPGGSLAGQQSVSNWVTSTCVAVPGFEAQTSNFGTPDGVGGGTATDQQAGQPNGGAAMTVTLYDCAAPK